MKYKILSGWKRKGNIIQTYINKTVKRLLIFRHVLVVTAGKVGSRQHVELWCWERSIYMVTSRIPIDSVSTSLSRVPAQSQKHDVPFAASYIQIDYILLPPLSHVC